jgi:hypothetical protein
MNTARSIRWALLGVAAVLVPTSAQAYIDPGTGSYLIQAVVAAIAGGAMAIKVYWHNVKAYFSGGAADTKDGNGDAASTTARSADE